MNHSDLKIIYSDLAVRLPIAADGCESLTLSAQNLPSPPAEIATDAIYALKGSHVYNDWFKIDATDFFAQKETYRHLGLLILSAVFHRVPIVAIDLRHPHSEITSLTVEYYFSDFDKLPAGYHTQPFAFKYYPELPAWHPFQQPGRQVDPRNLPCFNLANSTNRSYTEADWQQRDAIKIFGNDAALVLFAELLLNIGLPQNERTEFALESESGGQRAVGVSSQEARLFLPDHLYWTEEHWREDS